MRQNFRRVPVPLKAQQRQKAYTFPAPTRGWIANESLLGGEPGGALILENYFPTQRSARVRGGSILHATVNASGPCESLFSYEAGGGVTALFGTTSDKIFNITTVGDPTFVPILPAVSGQTSGYYSTAQLSTAGGHFLLVVNGSDDPQLFDGATWIPLNGASTPTLTGASNLSQVWKYRSRLYFVQENTLSAWYLAVNSIGGALTEFPLNSVFQRGGSLLFGATWSLDSGSGIDDKAVFVTDQGEFAVYQGSNPSDINTWNLVGRYDIAKPMGKNAWMQVGGDLLIATADGIVPISQAVRKDPAALSISAVTRAIEPEWKKEVASRSDLPWEMVKWTSANMGLVSWPVTADQSPYCAVVNLQTGAWAKYTGWNTRCLCVFDDKLFFGTNDGKVMQGEQGGSDNGALYTVTYVGEFDALNSMGQFKTVRQGRTVFLSSLPFSQKLTASTNYTIKLPSAPSAAMEPAHPNLWDIGQWDEATWDSDAIGGKQVVTKWVSIGRSGFSFAPQVQISFGGVLTPNVELVSIDFIYDRGAIVV